MPVLTHSEGEDHDEEAVHGGPDRLLLASSGVGNLSSSDLPDDESVGPYSLYLTKEVHRAGRVREVIATKQGSARGSLRGRAAYVLQSGSL